MNIIIVDDDKLVSLSLKTILKPPARLMSVHRKLWGRLFFFIRNSNRYSFDGYPNGWNERTDCRKADSRNLPGCQNFVSHYVFR